MALWLRHPSVLGTAFFFALSVAWTWPLVLSPASGTVALHFDQLPAAWLVHAAPTFLDGTSELSMWPVGEPLARLDAFVFLALAIVLQGVVPGLLLTNLFVLLGPVASAWAAERLARGVGVAAPYSIVCGVLFGFAPLATVAALEGHIYYLLDPWLPLAALYTWQRRPWPAVAMFTLALLTTAYLGVNALLVILAILAHQRRLDPRLLGGVALVGAVYAATFVLGSVSTASTAGGEGFEALLRVGSASLATLVAWDPWVDLNRHSLAPVVGVLPLCLALLAPLARIPSGPWLALGGLALLASFGPVLEAGVAREGGIPTLLWPLHALGLFSVYRFPVRFAWITALAFGVLAARVAERMRGGRVVIAFAVIDVLFVSGAYTRLRLHPTPTPTLYGLLPEGAVLDLYPRVGGVQEDMAFYQQNLSCYYQLFHHRPILERCLNTDIRKSPRLLASDRVHEAALSGGDVAGVLAALDVASVVMHVDLYQPSEHSQVQEALSASLGQPLGEGRDGGEWLLAWRVP
jgi:hypothetical protein